MPTRLLRTDTVANIADFGAIPDSPGSAAINASAFREALAESPRVTIPAGEWYLEEIMFDGNEWLPPDVEIFGQGSRQTFLRYAPTDNDIPLFQFYTGAAGGYARSTIRDLTAYGPVQWSPGVAPVGIGVSFDRSLYCRVRDVALWDFGIGVQFNLVAAIGGVAVYSAHNVLERFEINRCPIGIRARDATNGCTIQNGRIYLALYQEGETVTDPERGFRVDAESGVGIDIEGTTISFGPLGTAGVLIQGVQVESAATCVRVVNAHQTTIVGGYVEPGSPPGLSPVQTTQLPPRRTFDIQGSTGLVMVGNNQSEGGPGTLTSQAFRTPSYYESPPEDRTRFSGTSIKPHSDIGTFVTGFGSARDGATAAHANRIRNADMSRGSMAWTSSGAVLTPSTTDYVTGGASLRIQVATSVADHISQNVVVDTGVRSITVGVRYQLLTPTSNAFRIEIWDVDNSARLALYTDVDDGNDGIWRIRTLSALFNPQSDPFVVGPRQLQVRLYPYNGPSGDLASQEVLVDSVWLVDGEFGPTFRPNTDGNEVLRGDDRETFFSGTTSTDVAPTAALPSQVPSNAIGMVVELRIEGTAASTFDTILRVDDNEGADQVRDVHAFVNSRANLVEYTLPVTPGGASPQWSVVVGDPSNSVSYAVRLKQWILRL